MQERIGERMKRISLIALLCFVCVSTIFSFSFSAGDKEITLIDLPGYKHADITVFQGVMDITGVVGKDLLIPDTVSIPGVDDDGVYHDYFKPFAIWCGEPRYLTMVYGTPQEVMVLSKKGN